MEPPVDDAGFSLFLRRLTANRPQRYIALAPQPTWDFVRTPPRCSSLRRRFANRKGMMRE
jgi:hypothetical protein